MAWKIRTGFSLIRNTFEHELKRGIKLTGLHKIRVHDTRHSHAAHLIHMGASPLQIRDRLGHEDIKTTLNTYGHLYPNTDQKMAEQLESEYRRKCGEWIRQESSAQLHSLLPGNATGSTNAGSAG